MDIPNLSMSKGKKRYAMPQIDKADQQDFIKWAMKQGLIEQPKKLTLPTKSLIPTQAEFNKQKIIGMAQSGNYRNKRIMISGDNRIMDGHHTWAAAHRQDGEVKVLQFSPGSAEMLQIMKNYPKSYTKKLNESLINAE